MFLYILSIENSHIQGIIGQ